MNASHHPTCPEVAASDLKEGALVFRFLSTYPVRAVLPDETIPLEWSSFLCRYWIGGKSFGLDLHQRLLAEDRTLVTELPPRALGSNAYKAGSYALPDNLLWEIAATNARETSICHVDGDQRIVLAQFDHRFYHWALFSNRRKFPCRSALSPLAKAVIIATAIDWAVS